MTWTGSRHPQDIEHIGSAHDDLHVEVLKAVARQRLTAGQGELDLGLERTEPARRGACGPLPMTSSRIGHLLDALTPTGYWGSMTRPAETRRSVIAYWPCTLST